MLWSRPSTIAAVSGKKARPDVIGEKWRFSCMKNVRKKNTPKMPAAASRIDMYAPPRARSRTMCSGSRGCLERPSIATKVTSNTGEAASAMIVAGAVQECVSAFEKPKTSANRPSEPVSRPGTSIASRSAARWLTSSRSAKIPVGIAITRFT